MKKFILIFVLLFAYFVCALDVLAYGTSQSCRDILYHDTNTEYQECLFNGLVTSTSTFVEDGYRYYSYDEAIYIDYSLGSLVSNNIMFGSYSDNRPIRYMRPPNADSWNDQFGLYYSNSHQYETDDDGNLTVIAFYDSTRTIDYLFPIHFNESYLGESVRLDFAFHVNFTNIPADAKNNIWGSFDFPTTLKDNGNSICSYNFKNYTDKNDLVYVSCAFEYDGSDVVYSIKQLRKADYRFTKANSYEYHGYFDVSDFSIVISTNQSFEGLSSSLSPTGDMFDDNYNRLQTNSINYFDNFNSPTFNGLTRIIASPLNFISSLRTDSSTSLFINLFNKNIELKSGNSLFWNNYIYDSTPTCDSECLNNLRNTFKVWWGNFFGGILVYFSALKLFKVCLKLFDPSSNNDVEVF